MSTVELETVRLAVPPVASAAESPRAPNPLALRLMLEPPSQLVSVSELPLSKFTATAPPWAVPALSKAPNW